MLFDDVANGCYENILNIIVKWSGMNVNEYIKNCFCLKENQSIAGGYHVYSRCNRNMVSGNGVHCQIYNNVLRIHWIIDCSHHKTRADNMGRTWFDNGTAWKCVSDYCPFVRGIHRSLMESLHIFRAMHGSIVNGSFHFRIQVDNTEPDKKLMMQTFHIKQHKKQHYLCEIYLWFRREGFSRFSQGNTI